MAGNEAASALIVEARRLADEGSIDAAVELLRARAVAEPGQREALEAEIARLLERRTIGQA